MEEKRYQQVIDQIKSYLQSEYAEKLLQWIAGFFSGMICSRGIMFGKYAPFGIAAVAAAPRGSMWAAALGAFAGYLLPSPVYIPARYNAAIIAVVAIRWSLSELKSINRHVLFAPAITFLPLILTGGVMLVLNGAIDQSAALFIAESFLAAGYAFFLCRAGELVENKRREPVYDSIDLASVVVSLGIFILSLSQLTISGISVGRILTVLMVLYCSRIGGVSAGTIAGVAAGAIQGLSTAGLSYLSGAYGLGGMVAGAFAPLGKIAVAIGFVLSHGIASLQVGQGPMIYTGMIEVAAATILYMVIPKSRRIAEMLTIRQDTLSGSALRGNMIMRLKHAADALTGVYSSVDEISEKLSLVCAPNLQGVYSNAMEKICAGCAKSALCWRKYKEDTMYNYTQLSQPLKENGSIEVADFTKGFRDRCVRQGEMRDEINKNYNRYLAKEAAELKSAQVREVVEAHFITTAGILTEIADEFTQYQHFDDEAAKRIATILRDNGLTPIEVCCRIDKYDRMTVEAEVEKERRQKIDRATFVKEINAACGRTFSPPCVSSADNRMRIQMCQRPRFEARRGFSQYNANNSAFCGDCAAVFYDGAGHLIALLSDGMGTGGRAAVDGAMAAAMAEKLLKAGIGYESMLQTVNAALMAKSGDESLATLDITTIDLFTGLTAFRKAGAAGTLLRRGKKVEFIESASLPAGIMPTVEFDLVKRELEPDDMIVMISDGVIANGSEWLIDFVQNCDMDAEPNALAEQITERAKKERCDGHEDDVSVLILVLE